MILVPLQDYQSKVTQMASSCRACQQSSLTMCTNASLTALIGGSSGTVKAAWCTDSYLVIVSNKAPSWTPNLVGFLWCTATTCLWC